MQTQVIWTCEYRYCNNTFLRYQYQIKKKTGRFCCQSHASLEYNQSHGEKHFVEKNFNCRGCGKEGIAKLSTKTTCKECQRIFSNVNLIRKEFPNFQEFLPIDYYKMLGLQNNKCAICKVDTRSIGKSLAIDHDHETGKVRGLLCLGCNTKLGWFDKNTNSVIMYLNGG